MNSSKLPKAKSSDKVNWRGWKPGDVKRRILARRHRRRLLLVVLVGSVLCLTSMAMSGRATVDSTMPSWRWQLVSERQLAVYGAYLDYQDSPSSAKQVLVMAVLNRTETRPLYCHMITDSSRPTAVATVGPITARPLGLRDYPEPGKVKLLQCPTTGLNATPVAVRVSGQQAPPAGEGHQEWIPVYSVPTKTLKTVWCVGPLYDRYDEVQIVVEQLEWAKLQGFDQVLVYVDSAAPQVLTVLSDYEREGLVQVIDWAIAHLVNRSVYYLGQVAILNDCVYRNKHRAKYVFLHDIDERVVVPRRLHVMDTLESLFGDASTGAVSVKNAFFRRAPPGSSIRMHSDMKSPFYDHRTRSKLIVQPTRVAAVDIHEVERMLRPYGVKLVGEETLFLAHFRFETTDISYATDSSLPDYVALMAPVVRERMKRVRCAGWRKRFVACH